MNGLTQDIRFGLRSLRNNPSFFLAAIVALALGIGANSAIFTVVNSVVLQPLPFPNPERLAMVYAASPNSPVKYGAILETTFAEIQKQSAAFENLAMYGAGPTSMTGMGEPVPVKGWTVTTGSTRRTAMPNISRSWPPWRNDSGGRSRPAPSGS